MPLESSAPASDAIAAVQARLSKFETEAGRMKGLSYAPRPGDVFIVTTPKAGTTWLQQIVHQLRTGGDMDFAEISEVVPWVEMAADQGQDLEAPQRGDVRAFKTHCWEPHAPKGEGARYIVVLRDPRDVAVSFFRFFEGWFFAPGEVTLEQFVREFWLARGAPASPMANASYWDHLLSWWPRRFDDDVLLLFYEDLRDDLPREVARVARFIGCAGREREALAVARASRAYMQAHEAQFDEKLSKRARNAAMGLAPDAGLGATKVGCGGSAARGALGAELRDAIDARWRRQVEPAAVHVGAPHGLGTYEELRQAVHAERRRAGTYADEAAAGGTRPRPRDADPRAPDLVYDAGAEPRPCVRRERPRLGVWGSLVGFLTAVLP